MPKLISTYTFESNEADYNLSEIDNLKIMIHTINLAIQALTIGRHQSYQMDTGQSSQRVTRLMLPELVAQRSSLINELESRQSAAGLNRNGVNIQPCF